MSELVKKCERCGKKIHDLDNEKSYNNFEESNKIKERVESNFVGCMSGSYRNDGFEMWKKINTTRRKGKKHCASCTIFLALMDKFGNKKTKYK